MTKIIAVTSVILLFAGCARVEINKSIESYEKVHQSIQLGDSKQKVLKVLLPTQKNLTSDLLKKPEKYIKNGHTYYVYYARSAVQSDGLTTDDEFTPYVFKNNKLIAIGWSYLGGAKTQGQSSPTVVNYTAPTVTPVPTYNTYNTYKPYTPYP